MIIARHRQHRRLARDHPPVLLLGRGHRGQRVVGTGVSRGGRSSRKLLECAPRVRGRLARHVMAQRFGGRQRVLGHVEEACEVAYVIVDGDGVLSLQRLGERIGVPPAEGAARALADRTREARHLSRDGSDVPPKGAQRCAHLVPGQALDVAVQSVGFRLEQLHKGEIEKERGRRGGKGVEEDT